MKPLLPLLALLLASATGCGDDGNDRAGAGAETVGDYGADLRQLNGSGVNGEAEFELGEDVLVVRITATGVQSDRVLAQYIKGFTASARARCPDDSGRAGRIVDRREGRSAYGRTVFAVEPFPTIGPQEDTLRYDLKLPLSEAERRRIEPLESRVLVLAGGTADIDGDGSARYLRNLPVACGEIRASD